MTPAADYDDIERLAYSLWLERGSPAGSPLVDWERAERLVAFARQSPVVADTHTPVADGRQTIERVDASVGEPNALDIESGTLPAAAAPLLRTPSPRATRQKRKSGNHSAREARTP